MRRLTNAQKSKAVYVKRWFGGSRLPEVSGEHPASLDKKCAGFAQAYRAGNCRKFPFSQAPADQETKGESRDSGCAAGIALGVGSLGDGLSERKLLSGHTNPVGVAAGGLFQFVNRISFPLSLEKTRNSLKIGGWRGTSFYASL
jgi:hypothetical protein